MLTLVLQRRAVCLHGDREANRLGRGRSRSRVANDLFLGDRNAVEGEQALAVVLGEPVWRRGKNALCLADALCVDGWRTIAIGPRPAGSKRLPCDRGAHGAQAGCGILKYRNVSAAQNR